MSLDGVRLTFPDDRVFRITQEPSIVQEGQPKWLIDGLQQIVAAANQLYENNPDVSSNTAGIFDGVGAGIRTFTVSFQESIGSGNTWGNSPSDANAREKADELAHALTTVRFGSSAPVVYEGGKYVSGEFGSLTVVPGTWDVTAAYGEGESPSIIDGRIDLFEAIDTSGSGDGTARGT